MTWVRENAIIIGGALVMGAIVAGLLWDVLRGRR